MLARDAAAQCLQQVLGSGRSLADLLPPLLTALPERERALCQELCYGVCRWQPRLEVLARLLLSKALKAKDLDIHCLILLGLYQLEGMNIPAHAAVAETVAAVKRRNKPWAGGLVNAVLRRYQREQAELNALIEADPVAASAHPKWLLEAIRSDWPEQWPAIVQANNERPPMTLRVNRRHHSRERYLALLKTAGIAALAAAHAPDAITLEQPVGVERLPGFTEGHVSVQDSAAQLAAGLLRLAPGQRVLDACAAPGGKTGHILESADGLEVIAIDQEARRLQRVEENLQRLGLQASLVVADAANPTPWWDGQPFDRILLDAPCSATGVIRRHPDIKLLRRAEDIAQLVKLQGQILQALWLLLKPGGLLLYATCSTLRRENEQQVANFLAGQEDARELTLQVAWGQRVSVGRQILAGQDGMDGFYYACLEKH
jgi:16S rRNA (cytosine967-C5)-methyltransferase